MTSLLGTHSYLPDDSLNPDNMETELARLPLFQPLSKCELSGIVATARSIHAGKGEILFHKGDPCHGFYLLVSGKVKLLFNSLSGSEKVIEIVMPGQCFGESVLFSEHPYPFSAHSLSAVHLIYITKTSVLRAMESNHQLAQQLIASLSTSLHQLFQNQEYNGLRSGKQRIVDFILRQMHPNAGATPVVVLPASKGTIASHLGITPEHFSRTLHEMVHSELISVYGSRIRILALEQFQELLDFPESGIRQSHHCRPCQALPASLPSHQHLN